MEEKEILYKETISTWNDLCDLHKQLFEITSEEYVLLLSGDVEKVEESIARKKDIIEKISKLDSPRENILSKINYSYGLEINNFFELSEFFSDVEFEKKNNHLNKFNIVLKNLIKNIQKQNKANQLFINKAILNLDKIKNAGSSNKNYSLYNSNGALNK